MGPMSALFVVLRAGRECPVRVYGSAAGSGLAPALSLGSGSDRVVLELPDDAGAREAFLARLVDAASALMAEGVSEGGAPAVS
jgi:hypothetical protein